MKVVVTGAAGFIGSHLSERLLAEGHEVLGIDAMTDYYDRKRKAKNLLVARDYGRFSLREVDLAEIDMAPLLDGAEVIYHLAGQPGVRPSWGSQFDQYAHDNIIATQRLLEAVKDKPLQRLVFAGSSSVYGDAEVFPTKESALPRPLSPYGVTKLAAEHLTQLYWRNFGVPSVSVRYFTVYGPRQRPDMAFTRFMQAMVAGEAIEVYGDGEQTREFTYVADAVEGTLRAARAEGVEGGIFNLGGGSRVTLNQALLMLEEVSGLKIRRKTMEAAKGDPRHTGASIELAKEKLGWTPRVSLREGLSKQWAWFQDLQPRESASK